MNYESTYILNGYDPTPTFHSYRGIVNQADVTICGRTIYAEGHHYAISLPREHSEKFGKPCRVCYRDGAA